ncbi:MAG: hypothetical protein ACXWQZ_24380 [Ktedonobacterales bacterium]
MKRLLLRKWTLASAVGVSSILLIGALLLTGVLPGATRPAHAATTPGRVCDLSAQHSVCTGRAVNASAFFQSNDGCLFTDVSVWAFQDLSQSGATDPSAGTTDVMVDFSQEDTCNFTQTGWAEGKATGVDFQGDTTLNTATLNATVPLTDSYSGQPTGITLTLSLTWHGVGATRTGADNSRYRSPSGLMITRYVDTLRSAITVGTITDGGATNYAATPATYSDLATSQGQQIVIDHP